MSQVKIIEIDFEKLYELGGISIRAIDLLKKILDTYKVDYELLVNLSPDVGVEYLTSDQKFIGEFERADVDDLDDVVEKYAKRRKADAVVRLYDGYELAWAIVWRRKDL